MTTSPYKVLALKYRPKNFEDLIGQEVLVRTITNAIETNRIANAFVMTGIRGVGKTTTARIIARVLNCIGADGKGGPTPQPCGVCTNCISISEDRHPDVLEMDAASRTGVDDIREIIDNSRYLPTMARYKIFIIDEVHMLSKNAFNALLKTLEEPPAHVKFIFATTEIRKIPITILSRCQRFDLRRIDNEILVPFLRRISDKEQADIETEALQMIANASEGSVRDSLSLLDQAISHSDGKVTAIMTQTMLGLADKSKIMDIFDHIAGGEIEKALAVFRQLYDASADPVLVLQDLLEFNYLVTKIKVMPSISLAGFVPENEYARAKEISGKLGMAYLTRSWQMLLKGLDEVKSAANTLHAAEMILIRLAYVSDLPSPAALVKKMQGQGAPAGAAPVRQAQSAPAGVMAHAYAPQVAPSMLPEHEPVMQLHTFDALVELFKINKEPLLYNWLVSEAQLVSMKPGRLELGINRDTSADFPKRVSQCLKNWTGQHWMIATSESAGMVSLREQKKQADLQLRNALLRHPDVAKVLEIFPGATVAEIVKND